MIRIYRIYADPAAPVIHLYLPGGQETAGEFDGSPKAHLSNDEPFRCDFEGDAGDRQFLTAQDGVLVLPEGAMECVDMYYALCTGAELLACSSRSSDFRAVNPTGIYPVPPGSAAPAPVDRFYAALMRVEGAPKTAIFCVSGVSNPMNEFKHLYDTFGFRGLVFREIWRDEP